MKNFRPMGEEVTKPLTRNASDYCRATPAMRDPQTAPFQQTPRSKGEQEKVKTHTAIIALATICMVGASSLTATPAAAAADYDIARWQVPADVDDATPVAYLIIDANGKRITDAKFRVEVIDGKRYAVAFRYGTQVAGPNQLECQGWNSPIPTYSWSDHTMHYGMWGQCNEPVEVRARGSLWSGPYPESTNTLQDSLPGGGNWTYGIGTVSIGRVRKCIDWGGFDWWESLCTLKCCGHGAGHRSFPIQPRQPRKTSAWTSREMSEGEMSEQPTPRRTEVPPDVEESAIAHYVERDGQPVQNPRYHFEWEGEKRYLVYDEDSRSDVDTRE